MGWWRPLQVGTPGHTPGQCTQPNGGSNTLRLQFELSLLLHLTPTLSILLTSCQFTQKWGRFHLKLCYTKMTASQPSFWHLLKNCIFFSSKVTFKTASVTFSFLSKREKKTTKIYENHKIGKLFLLCSLEGYGQHFMSRSLSTKTTVSSTRSFWYNIVLGEIGLIFEQICKRWVVGVKCKSRLNSNRNIGPHHSNLWSTPWYRLKTNKSHNRELWINARKTKTELAGDEGCVPSATQSFPLKWNPEENVRSHWLL